MIRMHDAIRRYYDATQTPLEDTLPADFEPPVTWVKIFYKEYPRLERIKMEPSHRDGKLRQVLRQRKSVREFQRKPLRFEDVSSILVDGLGIVDEEERRPYPSGGARYPVETYLISFEVEKLDAGAYHYNVRDSSLELLLKKNLVDRSKEFTTQYIDWVPATLLFTSVIPRSEVKYGANAYRFSLLEAGHMAQNVSLLCVERGLGSCPVGGFVNDTVREVLDLTENEIPIYALAVGYPKV